MNAVQTEKLYRKAVEYAGLTGKETVLDAYCGIGTIGTIAAGKAGRVIGVELNGDAVRDAVANARRNQIGNNYYFHMPTKRKHIHAYALYRPIPPFPHILQISRQSVRVTGNVHYLFRRQFHERIQKE